MKRHPVETEERDNKTDQAFDAKKGQRIEHAPLCAAVLTVSDRAFRGERVDAGGPLLCRLLEEDGFFVVTFPDADATRPGAGGSMKECDRAHIVPDEVDAICAALRAAIAAKIPLIVTTGGTGFAPRDVTPEATRAVGEKEVPGIGEAMRRAGAAFTPLSYLSRGIAVIAENSLIINFPGSPRAITQGFDALRPFLRHGLELLTGEPDADGHGRHA